MVEVEIDTKKSVAENANDYYYLAKKAKKKLLGAEKTIEIYQKQLDDLLLKKEEHIKKIEEHEKSISDKKEIKKEWFEKFRWFYTSKGHLVIGGRDATTNEIVIKKYTDEGDLVFHTDMAGSPFFILKLNKEIATEQEIKEVGCATATFSRGFKLGLATNQVFYVNPNQVTKEANQGEYISKGAFMIRGKTNYVSDISMEIAICIIDGKLVAAPFDSIISKLDVSNGSKEADKIVVLIQGDKKPSDVAKIISLKLDHNDLDDIISKLPSGTFTIVDDRKIKEKLLDRKYKR